ncbi:MAG TPA: endonuclease/exonuclease/phosphatase family protein, partial [Polyangiaceae bacterium]|nr:endonuclease/exonuclease/phosphatase family protein [Polyangiaceae bacterium]
MELRIASYNVHGFVGSDGQRDVRRTARVIRALNADVVALQEVVFTPAASGAPEPVEVLAELSGFEAVSAPIERRDGVSFGNAVLTRLPVTASRRICLDYPECEPRTAL